MRTGLPGGPRERAAVAAILAVNLCLSLGTGLITLRNFPNSADEYAYVLSARLFSEGRLSAPSPEPRAFFDAINVVNDGRYYGKYSPGWPGILSLGVLAGIPWLINPLLGAGASVLIYLIAREHFPERTAILTACCMLASPFLVFNSASYFSHPSCLFFLAAATLCGLRTLSRPEGRANYVLLGLGVGLAFLIRPYTAVAIGAALVAGVGACAGKSGDRSRSFGDWAAAAVPLILCVALSLAYNRSQTGSLFLQPFNRYDPNDHPRLPRAWTDVSSWGRLNLLDRAWDLNSWIPLSPVLALGFFAVREHRRSRVSLILMGLMVAQILAQFFYSTPPGNQYGPRYWYESSFVLFIFMGALLRKLGTWAPLAAFALIAYQGCFVYSKSVFFANQVRQRMLVYDLADQAHLQDATVFLRTGSGSMPAGDLTRNGTSFDGPVWYVHDRGAENASLMLEHPERIYFVYEFYTKTSTGKLVPVPSGRVQRPP